MTVEYIESILTQYGVQFTSALAVRLFNELSAELRVNGDCMNTCLTCNMYDHEKHYCPRWCDVIRDTIAELDESYEE